MLMIIIIIIIIFIEGAQLAKAKCKIMQNLGGQTRCIIIYTGDVQKL